MDGSIKTNQFSRRETRALKKFCRNLSEMIKIWWPKLISHKFDPGWFDIDQEVYKYSWRVKNKFSLTKQMSQAWTIFLIFKCEKRTETVLSQISLINLKKVKIKVRFQSLFKALRKINRQEKGSKEIHQRWSSACYLQTMPRKIKISTLENPKSTSETHSRNSQYETRWLQIDINKHSRYYMQLKYAFM